MSTTNHPLPTFMTLESYPWSTDPDFQSGLRAILGTPEPQSLDPQTQDLTLRARCFYYARRFELQEPIDFDAYSAWRATQPVSSLSSLALAPVSYEVSSTENTPVKVPRGGAAEDAERDVDVEGRVQQVEASSEALESEAAEEVPTFQDVMELIQSGKPIPGIKDIADTVLVGKGTEPAKGRRQKPWEKTEAEEGQQKSGLFVRLREAEAT